MLTSFARQDTIPDCDVCVVGAGPVGIALALACERRGMSVLVLESGHEQPDRFAATLTAGHAVDTERHAAAGIAMLPRARRHLALVGRAVRSARRCRFRAAPAFAARGLADSPSRDFTLVRGRRLLLRHRSAPLHGRARLAGRFRRRSLRSARTLDARNRRRTPAPVAACGIPAHHRHDGCYGHGAAAGGRRSPRHRLDAGRRQPNRPASRRAGSSSPAAASKRPGCCCGRNSNGRACSAASDGPLGRGYMGHASGKIADLVLADAAAATAYDFFVDDGVFARRRFTLKPEAQAAGQAPQHCVLDRQSTLPPVRPSQWSAVAGLARARHRADRPTARGRRRSGKPCRARAAPVGQPFMECDAIAAVDASGDRSYFARAPAVDASQARLPDKKLGRPLRPALPRRTGAEPRIPDQPRPTARTRSGFPFSTSTCATRETDARSVLQAHELLDQSLRQAGLGRLEYRVPAEAADRQHPAAGQGRLTIRSARRAWG